MNKKILNILNTTAGQLLFSLLSGLGYFMIMGGWIVDFSNGQWLMLLYLAPIIICGAALVIVKLMISARENENKGTILKIFWLHVAVILIGILFVIARFQ